MARAASLKACVLISALLLLATSADAARSGRTLLKGGPTTTTTTTTAAAPVPSPPPPKAATTTTTASPPTATTSGSGSGGSGSGSGGGSTVTTTPTGKWDPMVSLAGDKCVLAKPGQSVFVNGYPSSPFNTTPLVFTKPYRNLTVLQDSILTTKQNAPCDEYNRCMKGFKIDIAQTWFDFGLANDTQCKRIPVLSYNNVGVPGPMMYSQTGVQDVIRFTNNIEVGNRYFPAGGPGNRGGEGETDLCLNRLKRYQQRNSTGRVDEVKYAGKGRATVIHFHGEASVPSMDGWAEQYFCNGESKDYILPNNRHATLFYHDHSVGITSENVYAGMAGMRIVRPCPGSKTDPYNVEADPDPKANKPGIPEWPLVIQDMVVDTHIVGDPDDVCRLKYDRMGVHHNQLWGDINLINGQPWPYLDVTASWQRFRILNASPSRPRILTFRDDTGKEIGSQICNIIGSDGGTVPYAKDHPMPPTGLMVEVAYRWDIICDFSAYKQRAVYLVNEHQPDRTTSETPYFCYSHLLMKLNVGAPDQNPLVQQPNLNATRAPVLAPDGSVLVEGTDQQDTQIDPVYFDQLVQRALKGDSDRTLKFGRDQGMWLFNGRGWDTNDNLGKGRHIEFSDVGQNTVELWTLEAGGGWVHPVHIHLVDFFCVAWQGADWDGKATADATSGWRPCPSELRYTSKDVMHIGANVGRITLAARWGPNLGEYMMHCHNNVHEDDDMFRAFMIKDAMGGLTFSKTPAFNYTSLQAAPLSFYDQYGDDRNTTYSTNTVAAPAFNTTYARKLLSRRYYEVFYPRTDFLNNATNNMWLTTCGTGRYNYDEDADYVPPAKSTSGSTTTTGSGRRLLRSDKHW